jgi:hypothetical protein
VASVSRVYKAHPLAERFPALRKWSAAYKALREDIGKHGLREEIVLYQEMILDGRTRAFACQPQEADVEPRYRQFDPATEGDPEVFVESINLHRRHLTSGQRVRIAHKLANGTWGGARQGPNLHLAPLTVEAAVARCGVSKSNLEKYREVLLKARPEVDQALDEGRISVHRMTEIAKLPENKQLEAVKDWKKIRDEHPETFELKRGAKTKLARLAQLFDEVSSDEKRQHAKMWFFPG